MKIAAKKYSEPLEADFYRNRLTGNKLDYRLKIKRAASFDMVAIISSASKPSRRRTGMFIARRIWSMRSICTGKSSGIGGRWAL